MKNLINLRKRRKQKRKSENTKNQNESFQECKISWFRNLKNQGYVSSDSDDDSVGGILPVYLNNLQRSMSSSTISWDEYGGEFPYQNGNIPDMENQNGSRNINNRNRHYSNGASVFSNNISDEENNLEHSSNSSHFDKRTDVSKNRIFDFVAVNGNNIIAYQGSIVKSLKREDSKWWRIKTVDGINGLVSSELISTNQIFKNKRPNSAESDQIVPSCNSKSKDSLSEKPQTSTKNLLTSSKNRIPSSSSISSSSLSKQRHPMRSESNLKHLAPHKKLSTSSIIETEFPVDQCMEPVQCIYEVPDDKISFRANFNEMYETADDKISFRVDNNENLSSNLKINEASTTSIPGNSNTYISPYHQSNNDFTPPYKSPTREVDDDLPSYEEHQQTITLLNESCESSYEESFESSYQVYEVKNRKNTLMQDIDLQETAFRPIPIADEEKISLI